MALRRQLTGAFVAVTGTAADVRDKIRRWEGLADEVYLGAPWASPDVSRTVDAYLRLVDAFRR